jgi:hypothetical protein
MAAVTLTVNAGVAVGRPFYTVVKTGLFSR